MSKKIFYFLTTFCINVVSLIEFQENVCFGMVHVNSHRKNTHHVKQKPGGLHRKQDSNYEASVFS